MPISVETFQVYPLGCNCSILSCSDTKEAIVIDPGGDEKTILSKLSEQGLTVKYIIHTHAHFDHCLGTKKVSACFSHAKVGLHKDDLPLYHNLKMQCSLFGVSYDDEEVTPITHFLEHEETLKWGSSHTVEVIHTPGHTPGSVCFLLATEKQQVTFSGDTLFQGSIGRTDLWGGDYNTIIRSIRSNLLTLDDSTLVIPGHGEFSTIYQEKKTNPYLI
jgi:hydroxyacylglutathione hydrolase